MSLPDNPKMVQAQKEGKVPMEFIPFGPLDSVARVMAGGAAKYGRGNWRLDPIRATTYIGAIARHALLEWAQGVDADKDDGEHPLAHVIACCLLVIDAQRNGTLIDDRKAWESKVPPALRTEEQRDDAIDALSYLVQGWEACSLEQATHAFVHVDRPWNAGVEKGEVVVILRSAGDNVMIRDPRGGEWFFSKAGLVDELGPDPKRAVTWVRKP